MPMFESKMDSPEIQESPLDVENRYRNFFRTSRDAAFITSKSGRWIDFNQATVEMLGYDSRDQLLQVPIEEHYADPVDRHDHLRRIEQQGFVKDHPVDLRRRDGSFIQVLITVVAIEDEDGEVIGFQGTARDISERQRQQKALRESEARLELALEGAALGTWDWNVQTNYVEFNERWAAMLGYRLDELEPDLSTWERLVHPDDLPAAQQELEAHLAGETPHYEADLRMRHKSGRWIWIHDRGQVVEWDEQGRPLRACGTHLDITERKRAEKALRESEKRFRNLFKSMRDAVFVHPVLPSGQPGPFEQVNEAACAMLGYSREELSTMSPWELDDPETRDEYIPEAMDELQRRGQALFEAIEVAKDGRKIPVEVNTNLVELYGEPYLISVVRDITERKEAERRLRESERKFRTLFKATGDAIFIHDLEGRILEVNDEAARRLGYTRQELLKMTPADFDAPEYAPLVNQRIEQLQQEGESIIETAHVTREGETIPTELSARLIQYEGAPAILSVARDISERKRMEEELVQQQRLAAIGQLAGGIAHDFNNILAAITLYAEMSLQGRDLPSSVRNGLETILEESHRAGELVEQILDFSRSAMLEKKQVDLVTLVEDAVSLLRRSIPEDIHLVTDLTPHPCPIEVDIARIEQALMNLVLNARDAMPDGGELRIAVERVVVRSDVEADAESTAPGERLPDVPSGLWACLAVSDTGTGMTEEVQSHLFEPFFTTKDVDEGTGLGLAQVYGTVRQHDGYVDVETDLGKGTTFRLFLPMEPEDIAVREETEGRGTRGGGETVLVVEDSEEVRRAVSAVLESRGYRVLSTRTGVEALDMVRDYDVNLVLTDVVMPEMGGEELLRHLQVQAPHLKAIAMTGYIMETNTRSLQDNGFERVVFKPFDTEDLMATVRGVLDRAGAEESAG